MDAQEMHDLEMQNKPKLNLKGSSSKLKALLKARNGSSLEPLQSNELDPTAQAMRNHPQLTRDQATQDAENLGF
jgi:hypothetical protein